MASCAQAISTNGSTSCYKAVTTGICLTASIIWHFYRNFDNEIDELLTKFVEDTKLEDLAKILGDRTRLQSNLNKLEGWTEKKPSCSSKGKNVSC